MRNVVVGTPRTTRRLSLLLVILGLLIVPVRPALAQGGDTGWPVEERCVPPVERPSYEGIEFPGTMLTFWGGPFGYRGGGITLRFFDDSYEDELVGTRDQLSPDPMWVAITISDVDFRHGILEVFEIRVFGMFGSGETHRIPWNHRISFPVSYDYIVRFRRWPRWWDNDHLIFESYDNPFQGFSPDTTFLINFRTGETTPWHGRIDPLAVDGYPASDWSRMVYRPYSWENWGVFDPISGELFAVLPAVDEVAWAPDSSRFVALLPPTDENSTGTLALFDRDGGLLAVVSQGTGETRIVLNADSWSPDGRYFTFGVYFGDEYHPILHLVDTQEQHSINTCVHGVGPVWHPDSGLITYLSYDLEYLTPPEEPCGICQEYEMLNLETWQRIVVAGATDPSLIGWRE